jgi:hypothetical protein
MRKVVIMQRLLWPGKGTLKTRASLFLLASAIALSACGPGALFGPTLTPTATVTPTASSTPIPTATGTATRTPTPTPTPVVYDGEWSGTTGAGGRVKFRIENNRLVSIRVSFGFALQNSSCNVDVNSTITPGLPLDRNHIEFEAPSSLAFRGTFDSATTAAGTLSGWQDTPNCTGGIHLTWDAEKQP